MDVAFIVLLACFGIWLTIASVGILSIGMIVYTIYYILKTYKEIDT